MFGPSVRRWKLSHIYYMQHLRSQVEYHYNILQQLKKKWNIRFCETSYFICCNISNKRYDIKNKKNETSIIHIKVDYPLNKPEHHKTCGKHRRRGPPRQDPWLLKGGSSRTRRRREKRRASAGGGGASCGVGGARCCSRAGGWGGSERSAAGRRRGRWAQLRESTVGSGAWIDSTGFWKQVVDGNIDTSDLFLSVRTQEPSITVKILQSNSIFYGAYIRCEQITVSCKWAEICVVGPQQ